MRVAMIIMLAALGLSACGPVGGTDVRISGSGAVGVSTSADYGYSGRIGGGPPPGRTASERQARKDYYRGPRGNEF